MKDSFCLFVDWLWKNSVAIMATSFPLAGFLYIYNIIIGRKYKNLKGYIIQNVYFLNVSKAYYLKH